MKRSFGTWRLFALAVVVAGGLTVASCGGGSVGMPPNAPASSQAIPVAGGTLTVPAAADGQSATLTFGAGATPGTTITASSSASAPLGAPAPSSFKRSTESIAGAVPFFFVTFTVSQPVTASLVTAETVALLSSFPAGASYYVEFDNITTSPGTKLGCAGPGTVNGLIASISNNSGGGACSNSNGSQSTTLEPGNTYVLQFYYVAAANTSASPTPTPAATATPTNSPTSTAQVYTFGGFSDSTGNTGCQAGNACIPIGSTDTANGVSASLTFTQPSVTTDVTVAGATLAQITPAGFPAYSGSGTVELYISLTASPSATFAMTPQAQVGGLSGETSCIFYGYVNNTGNSLAWTQISPSTGSTAVAIGAVTFPPVSLGSTISISATPFYGAVVCTP